MAYFTRLTLFLALLACTPGCSGDREFTFDTPGLALEQGQEAQAAGDEEFAKAAFEFAASSGSLEEKGEALGLLLDLALLPGGQEQAAQDAFARLQAHGPISGQDLVAYANLAADRAKMAVVAQAIVDFAFAQDPALQHDLEPIQLDIDTLRQAPKGNNSQIGYVDD